MPLSIYISIYSALFYRQELLGENNVAKVLINASRKLGTVQKQLLKKTVALQRDREALLVKCQPISYSLAQKLLMSSYKFYSAFGCWDPIKVSIVFLDKVHGLPVNENSTCTTMKNNDLESLIS